MAAKQTRRVRATLLFVDIKDSTKVLDLLGDEESLAYFEPALAFIRDSVERFGGTHHGYFLPHEGPNDLAFAAFSFPSLAAYETYRTDSANDADCQAAYALAQSTKCIVRYDRYFMRPVLEGDLKGTAKA